MPASVAAFVAESPIQREPIAAAIAGAAASLTGGARVLDAGAGQAPYRPLFEHCRYQTQDWPASAHRAGRDADIVCDLHHLDAPDASFDFVLCTEVLEHVTDPALVCNELHRVLRPGGGIRVTVPFVGELHEEPNDFRRFTSHGIEATLAGAGFEVTPAEPLTGYYGTLAHVLRHAGLSTRPTAERARTLARATAWMLLCASAVLQRVTGRLDPVLDQRRALPVGWICRGLAKGPLA